MQKVCSCGEVHKISDVLKRPDGKICNDESCTTKEITAGNLLWWNCRCKSTLLHDLSLDKKKATGLRVVK